MTDFKLRLEEDDLVANPTARVPICLCLDTSGSMHGAPIAELNSGVRHFLDAVRADEIAQWSAEVVVVTFGPDVAKLLDFGPVQKQQVPVLSANGGTPLAGAVQLALDTLDERKREYQGNGVDYYQPWLVLMTDGNPTDPPHEVDTAAARTAELVRGRKLSIFAIGIGGAADMDALRRFSPTRQPLRLQGLKFKEFFEWLSKSVQVVSRSTPGQDIELDLSGIQDWGKL